MATMVTDKAIEQVADSIDALAERAKQALYRTSSAAHSARRSMNGASETGWHFAERAREQAGEIAGQVVERGQQTAELVSRRVGEQPWMAVLVVGAAVGLLGMIVGYLARGR
jgi:ElaB/YqjD/DUF883 family membrane-anchored ribosome-binding protein